MSNTNPQKIWKTILSAKKPACILSSRFDYDAVGSAYTLKLVLKRLYGLNLELFFFNSFDEENAKDFIDIKFMNYSKDVHQFSLHNYDLFITVDAPEVKHLAKDPNFKLPEGIKIINIDHHISNTMFGDMNYVTKGASSNCRVIYDLLKLNEIKINKKEAYHLMLGYLTDTGLLQYSEVEAEDFRNIAELYDLGVSPHDLIWKIKFSNDMSHFRFMKYIYDEAVFDFKNRIVHILITPEKLRKYDLEDDHTNLNPADLLRSYKDIDLAITFFRDKYDYSTYNVSLRSRVKNLDVSKLAEKFGGGGHKMAAAFRITGVNSEREIYEEILGYL